MVTSKTLCSVFRTDSISETEKSLGQWVLRLKLVLLRRSLWLPRDELGLATGVEIGLGMGVEARTGKSFLIFLRMSVEIDWGGGVESGWGRGVEIGI